MEDSSAAQLSGMHQFHNGEKTGPAPRPLAVALAAARCRQHGLFSSLFSCSAPNGGTVSGHSPKHDAGGARARHLDLFTMSRCLGSQQSRRRSRCRFSAPRRSRAWRDRLRRSCWVLRICFRANAPRRQRAMAWHTTRIQESSFASALPRLQKYDPPRSGTSWILFSPETSGWSWWWYRVVLLPSYEKYCATSQTFAPRPRNVQIRNRLLWSVVVLAAAMGKTLTDTCPPCAARGGKTTVLGRSSRA